MPGLPGLLLTNAFPKIGSLENVPKQCTNVLSPVSMDRKDPGLFILSDYCMSSGHHFVGTGDWCRLASRTGSQDLSLLLLLEHRS